MAESQSAKCGLEGAAFWAGLFHDAGKARADFQEYLRACHEGRPARSAPHAKWGAALAWRILREAKRDLRMAVALPILGHHAGLANVSDAESDLEELWAKESEEIEKIKKSLVLQTTGRVPKASLPDGRDEEFAVRMIFSALVDADRRDTARFYGNSPDIHPPSLGDLWERLNTYQTRSLERLPLEDRARPINVLRTEVYESCCAAASGSPGVYSLTVPTGGGKTRSGLAFALRHAIVHRKDRIIVAIPFTSIIDQTARVYREILGDTAVLEFHSQVVDERSTHVLDSPSSEEESPSIVERRLAEETWNHPLIVTTTVQLFESLLSNRPSRVRKIQSIANSVIVLDEVQTLPTEVLAPTLDVLKTLVREYGVTVLLCTATQPTFEATPFGKELAGREINLHVAEHFRQSPRVEFQWESQRRSWAEVARALAQESQVLSIVNTRQGSVSLARALLACEVKGGTVLHLSTLLCPAHRRQVLEDVRGRLSRKEEIRLISTQVVEAGVDVDFPVVWRAVAPLDRMVQAAGRCNREGKLSGRGRVTIFDPSEESAPTGSYRIGMGLSSSLLSALGTASPALENPTLISRYFHQLYARLQINTGGFDAQGIQGLRRARAFEQVGMRYRLIRDDTVPMVVDYQSGAHAGKGPHLARSWLTHPSRESWRQLQSYVVAIRRKDLEAAIHTGSAERLTDGLARWLGKYDERFGLPLRIADPVDSLS